MLNGVVVLRDIFHFCENYVGGLSFAFPDNDGSDAGDFEFLLYDFVSANVPRELV